MLKSFHTFIKSNHCVTLFMKQNLEIVREMKEITPENDRVKCIKSRKIMENYWENRIEITESFSSSNVIVLSRKWALYLFIMQCC